MDYIIIDYTRLNYVTWLISIFKLKLHLLSTSSFSVSSCLNLKSLYFYIVDRRILAYQWHLCTRRHVKYPGSANIPRNARNVFRVPEPPSLLSLSLFSNPFSIRSAAVFPQWTISHVPLSVLASERFTALALYVSVRFYRRPFLCFHARAHGSRSKFPFE